MNPSTEAGRWRGVGAGRIEALTDTVFGLSITLLVVSLEVPQSFDDLVSAMQGFLAFGLSFAILIVVWYYHYRLFRQYKLDDGRVVLLNSVLLFVILFYVYPLKFVAGFLVGLGSGLLLTEPDTIPMMMAIYSIGFVLVFALFALLHRHAYDSRDRMGLTAEEVVEARESIADCLAMCGVGTLSVILALTLPQPWAGPGAGFIYFAIWPAQIAIHRRFGRERVGVAAAIP